MPTERTFLSPKIVLNDFQKTYISLIPPGMDLLEALDHSFDEMYKVCQSVSEEKSLFRYAPEKWSIKTMIMHISDTERIFQYRVLSIARNDENELPGFDENIYANNSNADTISFSAILTEYKWVALGFKYLILNMATSQVHRFGIANKNHVSPALIGFMTAGHRLHHLGILRERYQV